jgi:hypothetical protein
MFAIMPFDMMNVYLLESFYRVCQVLVCDWLHSVKQTHFYVMLLI